MIYFSTFNIFDFIEGNMNIITRALAMPYLFISYQAELFKLDL
jgi:hypothetical protein